VVELGRLFRGGTLNEVDKKLHHLQQQLERWILRSAYFLPDGDVLELYQSVQALEGIRKNLGDQENPGIVMEQKDKGQIPVTE
jgi:hypothetical protein